ncbi:anthrone oxygenase family protein [Microbacterium sp.]|uniref:anthrone oxygenase family protein n=1 Tax=Microbacterium sp. TaxID=51671 RepID=UPI002810A996|nr:anthrone oxygenase family protein [Microbacterium sp.]
MTALVTTVLILQALSFINGGVFLAFTTMVIPALRGARDPHAAATVMRDVNVRAPRSIFMVPFLGAPVAAIVAGILLVTGGAATAAAPWVIGAIAASLLAFVVSVTVNIPWNDRLERERGQETIWTEFSRVWARANAVRCALSIAAGAAAAVSLI